MLKQRLIHPEILEILAAAGHGSKVLIADGNYPASTQHGDNADVVYLKEFRGLMPDLELTEYNRFDFYDEASGPETCLLIVTGEQRLYANLLLTIGVVVL